MQLLTDSVAAHPHVAEIRTNRLSQATQHSTNHLPVLRSWARLPSCAAMSGEARAFQEGRARIGVACEGLLSC